MPHKRKPSPELEDVVTQIGDFIEYWGFKNVHGRIWAHLFLAGCGLDSNDLIQRLGISKALVSMSISELMEYDVIRAAGKSERGTILYNCNPDLPTIIANVLRKRERRLLARLSAATRILASLPREMDGKCGVTHERVEKLDGMVRTAESTLDGLLMFRDVSFAPFAAFHFEGKSTPDSPKPRPTKK
jgi:DNA-binding transcriptional regulator GbsR (MarR family)